MLSGFFIHTTLTMVTSLWPELSCNFETGLCGWYQDQASDFQWVHSTGQGQGSDHTTGSGKGSAPLLEAWPTGGTLQPPVPRVGCALHTLSSTESPLHKVRAQPRQPRGTQTQGWGYDEALTVRAGPVGAA